MKKLILLLFIPLVSFGQEIVLNEYYDDGKKVIPDLFNVFDTPERFRN